MFKLDIAFSSTWFLAIWKNQGSVQTFFLFSVQHTALSILKHGKLFHSSYFM